MLDFRYGLLIYFVSILSIEVYFCQWTRLLKLQAFAVKLLLPRYLTIRTQHNQFWRVRVPPLHQTTDHILLTTPTRSPPSKLFHKALKTHFISQNRHLLKVPRAINQPIILPINPTPVNPSEQHKVITDLWSPRRDNGVARARKKRINSHCAAAATRVPLLWWTADKARDLLLIKSFGRVKCHSPLCPRKKFTTDTFQSIRFIA